MLTSLQWCNSVLRVCLYALTSSVGVVKGATSRDVWSRDFQCVSSWFELCCCVNTSTPPGYSPTTGVPALHRLPRMHYICVWECIYVCVCVCVCVPTWAHGCSNPYLVCLCVCLCVGDDVCVCLDVSQCVFLCLCVCVQMKSPTRCCAVCSVLEQQAWPFLCRALRQHELLFDGRGSAVALCSDISPAGWNQLPAYYLQPLCSKGAVWNLRAAL